MSAPTEYFCRQQFTRLDVAPLLRPALPPTDPEAPWPAAREWVNAMLRNCQSNDHVEQTMTRFLETAEDPRNPIAAFVRIAQDTQRSDQPPPGCDICGLGPDMETGEMRWAAFIGKERPNGTSYAVRCDCARGQWLAEHEGRYVAEQAEAKNRPKKMQKVVDGKALATGDVDDDND